MTQKTIFPYIKGKFRRSCGGWRGRGFFLFRRVVAAGLFLAAVVITLREPLAAPGKPENSEGSGISREPTLALAHDLPAGARLTSADLRMVMMPTNLRPAKTFSSVEPVVGQILISPARSGELLTDQRLSSAVTGLPPPGKPAAGNPQLSIVPIRLSDPGVSDLLRPGSKITVISTDTTRQESRTLADNATVVTVIAPSAPATGFETTRSNPLVLIAVSTDISASVAAATLENPVTVTLR